jgi:hypothetical protein
MNHSSPEIIKNNYSISRANAVRFLESCIRNGLANSWNVSKRKWVKPYPEVTGYVLSLFSRIDVGDLLKLEMGEKLLKLQESCGGWKSFYGKYIYTFDSAQIGNGLLDLYKLNGEEKYLDASIKAATFILEMQIKNGSYFPIYDQLNSERISYGKSWGDGFSAINCKVVEFLSNIYSLTNKNEYKDSIDKICNWTIRTPQIEFSHPGAYSLEGLLAGGHQDIVKYRLEHYFLPKIEKNGFLAYGPNLNYAYVSGSVQIGLLCARVGLFDFAKNICHWAMGVQLNDCSGGLYQYANPDCSLNTDVHSEINSWGTKYFIELIDAIE